ACDAILAHGAEEAARIACHAHAGAEIHHALRIALDIALGQPRLGDMPQPCYGRAGSGIAVDSGVAREHAAHVAVEDRAPLAARECRDRRGGGAADARQRGEIVEAARKPAAETIAHLASGAMQVAPPGVIAEPAPEREHLVEVRGGEIGNRRPAREEALVVRDHRLDARLLQHDLGEPDAVRVAGSLPGQRVAALAALPLDDPGCERCRRARLRHRPMMPQTARLQAPVGYVSGSCVGLEKRSRGWSACVSSMWIIASNWSARRAWK